MVAAPSRIFLIGPMGSGKTTVGRALAERLGLAFADLDQEIESRCGVEVDRIFEIEGEAGFRQRESDMLRELAQRDRLLLATGGGTILSADNRQLMQQRGLVLWLRTSVDQQLDRLARDKRRPLLQTPDRHQRLLALAAVREPLYADCADLVLDSSAVSPSEMAATAAQAIAQWQDNKPSYLSCHD